MTSTTRHESGRATVGSRVDAGRTGGGRVARLAVAAATLLAGCAHAGGRTEGRTAATAEADSVHTGYGMQARWSLTGAVSTLRLDDDVRRPHVRSIEELLQGRIPGLEVGGPGGAWRVRGAAWGTYAEPLVVLDGAPLPSGVPLRTLLSTLDPSAVVRVDVLKDAAATAIHGARGANGVVLITLRHAKR